MSDSRVGAGNTRDGMSLEPLVVPESKEVITSKTMRMCQKETKDNSECSQRPTREQFEH